MTQKIKIKSVKETSNKKQLQLFMKMNPNLKHVISKRYNQNEALQLIEDAKDRAVQLYSLVSSSIQESKTH